MREELVNSYHFINNIGNFKTDGITASKLELIAESFNFKYEPYVLDEMVKVGLVVG